MSALLSLPIINVGLQILGDNFKASSSQISAFWLTGAIGSLTANALLSRGLFRKFSEFQLMAFGSVLMGLSYLSMAQSVSSSIFIICFSFHTLGNPLFNNIVGKRSIEVVSNDERGRFLSILYSAQDFGILIVLLLMRITEIKPHSFYFIAFVVLIVRIGIASYSKPGIKVYENS